MPVKTFQDFRNGVDRRKSEQIVDQLGLYECKNAFINSGSDWSSINPSFLKDTFVAIDAAFSGMSRGWDASTRPPEKLLTNFVF